jgi:thymidylate synthase (FAD)
MQAELIDVMGDDLRVVNSARVSFNKESDWATTEHYDTTKEPWGKTGETYPDGLLPQDQKLISYLAKNGHWTPFSHVQITMRETVPIFVARQRFKHMVGFTYNEVSRRYVDDEPEFFYPEYWRKRAENAKQGSSTEAIEEIRIWDPVIGPHESPLFPLEQMYYQLIDHIETVYRSMINEGVAPEQARMVLPQSMYTSYYVTGSLAAWARAYKLRSDPHAQKEIQDLAKQWDQIITNLPQLRYSWSSLTKGD